MIAERKRLARQRARAARKLITAEERTVLSAAACEHLLALAPGAPGTVLGYRATAEEIDPASALDALRERGWQVALPRICGPSTLSLHEADGDEASLETGPFGIVQPCETAAPVEPEMISLVIAPGIAFDLDGRRIGYGGGYYDRLLKRMRNALLVGLAYDGQIAEDLPADEYDVHMDAVVTPSRTVRVR